MQDNSMTIEFQVNNQIISRTDSNRVVEDSANYLYAHFTFSEDWDNTTKAIIIENKKLDIKFKVYLDAQDTCKIPSAIIEHDGFTIMALGETSGNYVRITTQVIFIVVLESNYVEAEESYIKYIESDTLDVEKTGDSARIDIPNIYFKDATLANDVLSFFGRNNELLKAINMPYGLVNDITLALDQTNYTLTLSGYDKNNSLLFTRSVDFNIETKVFKTIYYDAQTQELVFVTMDDEEIRVPIGDILTGIATQDWVNTQLLNYVQKESGKGLSTNDYTNAEKAKLSGIESQAQVNILEGVKVNGEDLEILNKEVNIDLTPYAFAYDSVSYCTFTLDSTTYILTLTLYDRDNTQIARYSVDLPNEDAIVSGTYDSATQSLVFTRQSGTSFSVSIASLISGLQPIIDANNKLDADLVDDSTSTNKFTNATEKATWNAKQDALSGSESIDITSNVVSVKQSYIDGQFLSNAERQEIIDEIVGVFN